MTIPLSVVLTSDNYEYTEFLGRVEARTGLCRDHHYTGR